jgi:polyvinyl alcohol dehydrogenase (cytochrome)
MTRLGRRCAPLLALVAITMPAGAQAAETCDAPAHPAGEWPSYGHDLANTRHQEAQEAIDPTALEPAFVYRTPGLINTTPIVDGGCVFVASAGATASVARLAALDAENGEEHWVKTVTVGTAAFGGPAVGTPALFDDLVITPINRRGAPFVVAHDRHTGAERWRTSIDDQPSSGINASVIVHDGLAMVGFFGNHDAGSAERGGFVLLEAATGALVRKTYAIDDAAFADGYAGAGIWATAAVDTDTGFAYVGTSNPHSAKREHERSNAIIKIDLNRDSDRLGEIVASYKGVHDTLVPGGSDQPVCEAKEDVYYAYSFSATCLAIDLDFGASPNLFTNEDGTTLVGELQKSGVYHVVDTADMQSTARVPVGPGCFACSAASSAFAAGRAFVAAGPPGNLVAVDADTLLPGWAAVIGGGFTYNPVSVGGGLVWSVDSAGFLNGYEQRTGAQLVKRPLRLDTGVSMVETTSSSGIAIARDTLYTAATRYLIAFRQGS